MQRPEEGADDAPVKLLAQQRQVNELKQRGLQLVSDLLSLVRSSAGRCAMEELILVIVSLLLVAIQWMLWASTYRGSFSCRDSIA